MNTGAAEGGAPPAAPPRRRQRPRWLGPVLLLALLLVPRLVALDADTLPSLDWNPGIWTDEGFYTYNARNAVLFGHAELDQWNNRDLMPVLDWAQRQVFAHWGVGLAPARALSVACSLLALGFFGDALRRMFGRRVALYGLLLLGGEVTFILFNRLALMENSALVVVCAALWALAWGRAGGRVGAGALAAAAVAFKTTFLVFLPLPLLAWLWGGGRERRAMGLYALGAALGYGAYLLLWGGPHHAAIWRLNHFYWERQARPESVPQEVRLLTGAVGAYRKGLLQYLETRTPVLTFLALAGLLAGPGGRETGPRAARRLFFVRVLWLWTALGLVVLAASRYAPTRYYLIMYPGLAGLAALTLGRLPVLWRRARRGRVWPVAVPAALLLYHALLPALADWSPRFYGWALLSLAPLMAWAPRWRLPSAPRARPLAAAVLAAFLALSLSQWAWWYATRGYRTRDVSRDLARIVRPGELVAGDWGPNLCLDNRVRAAPVFPGLANADRPVQSLRADYVLLTETPYPINFWRHAAPDVIVPQNLICRFEIHRHRLSLFRVPRPPAP